MSLATVLSGLTLSAAHARELDVAAIRRTLAPVVERLDGSGLRSQSIAAADGRHRFQLATMKLRLTDSISVRAGAGLARTAVMPSLVDQAETGFAVAASASLTMWQGAHFAVDVSVSGLRAGYDGHGVSDTTVLIALRPR